MSYLNINTTLQQQEHIPQKLAPALSSISSDKGIQTPYKEVLKKAEECGISPTHVSKFMEKAERRFSFENLNSKIRGILGSMTALLLVAKITQVIFTPPQDAVQDTELARTALAWGGTSFNLAGLGNETTIGAALTIALSISGLLAAGALVFPKELDALLPVGTANKLGPLIDSGALFYLPDPHEGNGYRVVIGGGMTAEGVPDYIAIEQIKKSQGNCIVIDDHRSPGTHLPFVSILEAGKLASKIVSETGDNIKVLSNYVIALLMARVDLAKEITISLSSAKDLFLAPQESADVTPEELNMYLIALSAVDSMIAPFFEGSALHIVGDLKVHSPSGSIKDILEFWRKVQDPSSDTSVKREIRSTDTSDAILTAIAEKYSLGKSHIHFSLVESDTNRQYLASLAVRNTQQTLTSNLTSIDLCYDETDEKTLLTLLGKITKKTSIGNITGVFLSPEMAGQARESLRLFYSNRYTATEIDQLIEKQIICVTEVI